MTATATKPVYDANDFQRGYFVKSPNLIKPGSTRAAQAELQIDGQILVRAMHVQGDYWHPTKQLGLFWSIEDALTCIEQFQRDLMAKGYAFEQEVSDEPPRTYEWDRRPLDTWKERRSRRSLANLKQHFAKNAREMTEQLLGEDWKFERNARKERRTARIEAARAAHIQRSFVGDAAAGTVPMQVSAAEAAAIQRMRDEARSGAA